MLRFNFSLEGLRTQQAAALMVTVCCSERTQIKISNGKMHKGQGPGDTRHKIPSVLPQWCHADSA